MRSTRFEMINELRCVLGHSEETEHVIDWVLDAWETYDLLIQRVGRERAHQIINAMETCSASVTLHEMTSSDQTNEHITRKPSGDWTTKFQPASRLERHL